MPRVMNKAVWPYQTTIKVHSENTYADAEKWCKQNLYHGGYYEPNWYRNNDTFCFRDEKEYLHFLLVWQ